MKNLTFRIGYGYDVHAFAEGRELIIGGIKIEHNKGLDGHSDADVLLHAISDATLGALALGDIGVHFPPSNNKYKNIDSRILLREVIILMNNKGYEIGNIDATIIAENPKMNPHIPKMRDVIADIVNTDIDEVSLKATTSERLGFTGREEGIAASAVVLLQKKIRS